MPRNGSGTFTPIPSSVYPATYNTVIDPVAFNTLEMDIASGLTQSISKDGQTPITANLPMSGFKHTGVANGTSITDYVAVGQIQGGTLQLLSDTSGNDTITATATPTLTIYAKGQTFRAKIGGTNTGAATLNIDAVGAKAIQKNQTALGAGDLTAGDSAEFFYDGTAFQLLSPARTPFIPSNSLPLSVIAQIPANTVLVNNTASTANITTQALAASQFIARGSSGNIGAGTLGTGLAFTALVLDVVNFVGDSGSGGVHGAVPAPASGDAAANKFLKASGAWAAPAGVTLGTMQATTSGTSKDFTSIPAGTKIITVMFAGVSTNGTSHLLIQIGDSGGIENTGYDSTGSQIAGTAASVNSTVGFIVPTGSAATVRSGSVILNLMDAATNLWSISGVTNDSPNTSTFTSGGSKSLSTTLDRVRLTTVNGTDAFDAGNVNISYQ